LKTAIILGGENFNDQIKDLQKDPQFIVATPGRLVDHLNQRNMFLDGLELLILDEADRMLDLGFADQLKQIDDAANHRLRQTLFFSATLDNADVNDIAQRLLNEPSRVAIGAGTDVHSDIKQKFYLCDHLDHKEAILTNLVQQSTIKQVIVFTATKLDTTRLSLLLESKGFSTQALNGDLTQSARNKVMDSFARGHFQILVSTDLASRGLDIVNVTHVINFDIPKHSEEYIHRTGRTGRAGFQGDAYSLVGPKDWHNFKALETFLARSFSFDTIEGLEASFKGLAPKKVFKGKKKPQINKVQTETKAPVKRRGPSKTKLHTNNQDGFEPFRIPKKGKGIAIDDNE
jgi:superfamily II DNA/RNA helicase